MLDSTKQPDSMDKTECLHWFCSIPENQTNPKDEILYSTENKDMWFQGKGYVDIKPPMVSVLVKSIGYSPDEV